MNISIAYLNFTYFFDRYLLYPDNARTNEHTVMQSHSTISIFTAIQLWQKIQNVFDSAQDIKYTCVR